MFPLCLLHNFPKNTSCFSVPQLCSTVCSPKDCSMPDSLSAIISRSFLKLMSIELMMPFHPLQSPSPAASIFPRIRVFSSESALRTKWAKVLELQLQHQSFQWIQGWFPFGLTSLISLLSRGLSRVFSCIKVWKNNSFVLRLLYDPTLTCVHEYWKKHSFDYMDLCWQTDVSSF